MPKILIAEDEEDILKMYKDAISSEGFDVYTAVNGRDALEQVMIFKPAIVLLDLELPIMNGEEFLHELFNDNSIEKKPQVVIFSTWQTQTPAELVEKYNLSGFYIKMRANLMRVIENLWRVIHNERVNWFDVMYAY